MKKYEITGLVSYANTFWFEVEARNKKEAKELALKEIHVKYVDPASAEMQEIIIDKPLLIE